MFDPSSRLEMFVSHKLTRCIDPRDPDAQIFCWKFSYEFLNKIFHEDPAKIQREFFNRLKEIDFMIKVDEALVNASINHFMDFYGQFKVPDVKTTPTVMAIKTIKRYITPNTTLDLNWLSLVNNEFMEHSKALSEREEILIDDWKSFSKSIYLYEKTPSRIIMDVLFLVFLYEYEHV